MTKLAAYLSTLILALSPIYGNAYAGGGASAQTAPLNQSQLQSFQQQLVQAVQTQENRVQELHNKMARQDIVQTSADVAAYENAVLMLEIKRTLLGNFMGTPSLQSAGVRGKLLDIMNKDMITPSDLAELQSQVNIAKANAQAATPAATAPAAPAGTTTTPPTTTTTTPSGVGTTQ